MDLEEELMRIWGLVGELSEQLSSNRAIVAQLRGRGENVKGQAAHVGTGFPLRRFNLDISDEEFQTELEGFASHLVLENQTLQHENKQLNTLLKEYEQTLETVMGKFRGVAHASSQHDLSLHSYYTSLLQTLQTAHSSAQLHDNTSLSLLLTRLSTLLRSAMKSLGGEQDFDLATQLPGLLYLAAEDSSSSASSSSPISTFSRGPHRPQQFSGSLPGASGGYAGTEGQADWALEREMEITRLEEENKALREMLIIAQESVAEDPEPEAPPPPSLGRKGSLTVQDLELDAEKEEQASEKEKLEGMLGLGTAQPAGAGAATPAGPQGQWK
ncbi:hypothetical protein P7C73_g2879, partial [Tremellales sp. Uapishka_1]